MIVEPRRGGPGLGLGRRQNSDSRMPCRLEASSLVAARVRAYEMFAFSVPRFLVHIASPTHAVFGAAPAAIASLGRSAMDALGPGLLVVVTSLGARIAWPDAAMIAPATLLRAAAPSGCSCFHGR